MKETKISVGEIVDCSISNIAKFGLFVRFNNHVGLIHISEISDEYIDNLFNIFKIDDEFKAKIISIDERSGKIGLSKKRIINKVAKSETPNNDSKLSDSTIKDIWKIFIEVQETFLKFRQREIPIKQEIINVDNKLNRIIVEVNQKTKTDKFFDLLNSLEIINTKKTEKGADFICVSNHADDSTLNEMQDVGKACYISFVPKPVIEGHIKVNQQANKEDIIKEIRACFPNIQFHERSTSFIQFKQYYIDSDTKKQLYEILSEEFVELANKFSFQYAIDSIPEYGDRFTYTHDLNGMLNQESTLIKGLIGQEFYSKEYHIGKLVKVKYPKLVIEFNDEQKSNIAELVSSNQLMSIKPELRGENEKVNRLKDAFEKIIQKSDDLQNKMIAEYLFDATKATKTDEKVVEDTLNRVKKYKLNSNLNESQLEAIARAVAAKDLALIQGPPGTGKSTAIAELIWQIINQNTKEEILLTSETNLAVDNALNRIICDNNLVKPIRIGTDDKMSIEGKQFSINAMRNWAGIKQDSWDSFEDEEDDFSDVESDISYPVILENWLQNISKRNQIRDNKTAEIWIAFLKDLPLDYREAVYKAYVNNCNVIGATCSSIGEINYTLTKRLKKDVKSVFLKKYNEIFPEKYNLSFTTVIQDEASKATPAELSLPMIYGKKSVVIGDHRQLPPTIDKEEFMGLLNYQLANSNSEELSNHLKQLISFVNNSFDTLEKSHFERLYEKIDSSLKGIFRYQYRMHPDINDVIKQFYTKDGGLECGLLNFDYENRDINHWASRYHGIQTQNLLKPENHVVWIDTKSPEILSGTSRVNPGEIQAIDWILSELVESPSFEKFQNSLSSEEDRELGIISFYGAQLNLLKEIKKKYNSKIKIRSSSVDRFQGMERNIVVVSLVRSNRIAETMDQAPDKRIYGELGYKLQKSLGFAKSPNRLNVALSRAKRLVFIVGNSELFNSYKDQNDVAIYKNVYNTILNNPNGRIIPYGEQLYKEIPLKRNLSINLNTRDVRLDEEHIRKIETWIKPQKDNPKLAVLELSTKAVKLLIGNHKEIKSNGFNFDSFFRETIKTETGVGVDAQGKMDMDYFKRRVLPAIKKMRFLMQKHSVDVVYCVATAAYRTSRNRDYIISLIKKETQLNVRILSKQEEAVSTMYAYTLTTGFKDKVLQASKIIMIDQGGGSTEVSVFENKKFQDAYSINLGTTALRNMLLRNANSETKLIDSLKASDSLIRERLKTFYKNMEDVIGEVNSGLCISVGTAITAATKKKGNKKMHDTILTREKIERFIEESETKIITQFELVKDLNEHYNKGLNNSPIEKFVAARLGLPMFLHLMDRFGIKEIHVSGTGLWYGIYLQQIFNF